jgi:hypothetical protein
MFIFQSTIRQPFRVGPSQKGTFFFTPSPVINVLMKFWQICPESPGIVYIMICLEMAQDK